MSWFTSDEDDDCPQKIFSSDARSAAFEDFEQSRNDERQRDEELHGVAGADWQRQQDLGRLGNSEPQSNKKWSQSNRNNIG